MITKTITIAFISLTLLMSFAISTANATKAESPQLLAWQASLPRIQSIVSDVHSLEVLGRNHIGVIHGELTSHTVLNNLPDKDIHLTYAFTVIHASTAKVRSVLMDFEHYREIMPHITDSELLAHDKNHWLAQYRLIFQMPLVTFEPRVQIQHTLLDNGDLIERRVGGDIANAIARWQIIALSPNKTLLVQISWADIGSISWLMRLIFSAQPDLYRLSPLTAAALTLQSLRERIENRSFSITRKLRAKHLLFPDNARVLTTPNTAQQHALRELTQIGSVHLIAPAMHFIRPKDSYSLQPILSAVSVPTGFKQLKPLATDIKSYPRFMDAITAINKVKDNQLDHESQWTLGFDFSIFTFDVDFNIKGLWSNDQTRFTFASNQGDFDPLLGQLNWYPTTNGAQNENTLVTMGLAHNIDDNAGFILKAIKNIPYSQMFTGLYVGTLLIEGQQQLAPK